MAMSSLCATSGVSAVMLPTGRFDLPRRGPLKHFNHDVVGLGKVSLCMSYKQRLTSFTRKRSASLCMSHKQRLTPISRVRSASVVCSAALNARCGAEGQGQTQTVEKPVSVISNAPGKEKSPLLDDGGTGFPPRDDDGGGGGGGGGGGNWSGGFFFFGFLAFLGFLKDQENEGPYQNSRRR